MHTVEKVMALISDGENRTSQEIADILKAPEYKIRKILIKYRKQLKVADSVKEVKA